jgi:hypothetical protein
MNTVRSKSEDRRPKAEIREGIAANERIELNRTPGAQAFALVITHIFLLARLEAIGPKPRRGWPVYSNTRVRNTANPVGVTCARCKMVGPVRHLFQPLDWTWVRSPLRGLASVVSARGTINRPPPTGFGDSVAPGLAATRPAQAISDPQASSQQLWVMAAALACSSTQIYLPNPTKLRLNRCCRLRPALRASHRISGFGPRPSFGLRPSAFGLLLS